MIICILISLGCFYLGIAFCAVWKKKELTWLMGFIITILFDLILMEFGMELLILFFFMCRKNSDNSK